MTPDEAVGPNCCVSWVWVMDLPGYDCGNFTHKYGDPWPGTEVGDSFDVAINRSGVPPCADNCIISPVLGDTVTVSTSTP